MEECLETVDNSPNMSKILKLYYFPKAGNTGKDTISQIYMLKQFK